jgi:Tol biopolymer transport system component
MIGQTLSHYRITAALGAGGMGEVYRATDTHLNRDVAIKVLPPEVAHDAERLGRFRREAHLLASLNHPHIAAIYGLEEADGTPFLALELVEGEDLKQRLQRGPIPVDEALEMAEQIAEALEEAHNKGIVHRDLKPANVKITPDGKVKVLDFGLAKAWSGDNPDGSSPSAALSQSPTMANTGTVAGVILGTAAYMSPEQARGKPLDKRADVWSFGVLLWEMLTGRTLFAGDTVTDVIASLVKEEPDLDALPKATPPAVRRLLARCLRKDPRTRLPDIGAARLDLQEVQAGTDEEGGAAPTDGTTAATARRLNRQRQAWAAAFVVAAGAAVALAYVHLTETPAPRPPAHFAVDTPEGASLAAIPAVSPDGRQVVFCAQTPPGGPQMLWLRPLESMASRPLAGTEGGSDPVWSPDGRSLAFGAEGELRRLNLANGTVQRICVLPANGLTGITWSDAGDLLFSAGSGGSSTLFTVPASGGEAKPLTTLDASREEGSHLYPEFLPDGRHFVFVVASNQDDHDGAYVASLDAPEERRPLLDSTARVVPSAGHILYVEDGTLLAQAFDAERGELRGEPTAIASPVAGFTLFGYSLGWFSASPTGVLAYREGTSSRDTELTWVDRSGAQVGTLGDPGRYGQLVLSPDGRRVAIEVQDADGQFDLWTLDVDRGVPSRVTASPANERDPVWSPDGQELVFGTSTGGGDLVRKTLLAGSKETPLVEGPERYIPEFWSADGETLLAVDSNNRAVWAIPASGDGPPEAVLETEFSVDEPQLSPDARWLAYASNESGQNEVYVEPYRRPGERVRVSATGGGQPKWRADGKELFYVTAANRLTAVSVKDQETRVGLGRPADLFQVPTLQGAYFDDYAATVDGQRFLVKVPVGEQAEPRIHVLLNWPSLLEE